MTAALADLTWPSAARYEHAILALPFGSTEQHGPHLPLSTDTDIAVALCRGLARRRTDVLIGPPVPYGSAGEHAGFAGTLSIGQAALELLAVELVRSATESFARVLLVSGHGGNAEPLGRAVERLRAESRDVRLFLPSWTGDPHAGREETAMQLALDPQRVHTAEAAAGELRGLDELLSRLRSGGVRSVSSNGVLGDPAGADPCEGLALLEALTAAVAADVQRWWPEVPV